jgi:hypothetical protein
VRLDDGRLRNLTIPTAIRDSPRTRLAHDEQTLEAIRGAIAIYQRTHARLPADKAAVEALLTEPLAWQCTGQEWIYLPESGHARLLIADLLGCQTP